MSVVSPEIAHLQPSKRLDLFIAKVEVAPSGCWHWTGRINRDGYGQFYMPELGVGTTSAHRCAYALFVGPIPDGLQIDHLCRVRHCVNPAHLEAVTQAENIRRGTGADRFRNQTHCKAGHPFDEKNTAWRRGGTSRMCRKCKSFWESRRMKKVRAARKAQP